MRRDRISKTDKELWQSLSTGPSVASASVSDLDFAAWLEGRLTDPEAARIDAALAADPDMRRAALELSDILGKPLPQAPARMAVRAQSLVGFEVERRAGESGWLAGLLSISGAFALPRTAMASLAVLVAITGFMVGGGLGDSYAQEKVAKTAAQTVAENPSDLTALFTTDRL